MTNSRLLQTEACRRLGVSLPIVGAPMGGVAGPELAAAVSSAGGLGMLGHANSDLAAVREEIRHVKDLIDKPFGVGLLFPTSDRTEPPGLVHEPPQDSPPERNPLPLFLRQFQAVQPAGVPAPSRSPRPRRVRPYSLEAAEQRLDIVIEENVPVLACGLGTPARVVKRAKAHGIQVIALVGSRRAAVEVEERGVDIVVAQGHEAGGHTGRTTTFVLVPQLVDALRIPVLAAGGISDGRQLAAALMLGASGVLLGTRLLATPEARTADSHKARVVEMREDDTVVSRCYTGKPSRVLRNAFTDAWKGHENEILPMPEQWEMVEPVVAPAKAAGSLTLANWPTGQGAVLVRSIAPAAEVVRQLAAEAAALISNGGSGGERSDREGARCSGS
ncbi:NAD(P)H-dependent flavin oxidoreductase [Micromonospora sp. NPDC005299]|uniref:NAD(P)H-dependent flavin oxidoreductase n=1 Tax=Micromonospora sp. NPDC005299 TaxID=3364231 RepID=UPI0036AD17C1